MSGDRSLTPELSKACARRRHLLREAMAGAGVDALLVGHARDIMYLTGFIGDDSLLLVPATDDTAAIITDSRHDELLEPWRAAGAADVIIGTRHQLPRSAADLCRRHAVKRLGIQAEHVTIAQRRGLDAALGGLDLVETDGLVSTLRMCKDDLEIAAIERAIGIHEDAMRAALGRLSPGMSELELCAAIEYEMKVRGASGASFSTCVAAGPHSSVIHYLTGDAPIEEGVLLIDWGAVIDGYCSDMTRTFGVGTMPEKIAELYAIVLEAQMAAIDACGPGRNCAEIDSTARRIIEKAGYGEHFGHGLGHGLGLDIHEAPFFNQQATSVTLKPGMVMTVEPGIYLPGIGGVRIEDDVLITDGGHRVLTSFPKSPSDAVLEPLGVGG